MAYREEGDQVVLTMSRREYDRLLMVFALATMRSMEFRGDFPQAFEHTLELLNSLNAGNPNYRPYQVAK